MEHLIERLERALTGFEQLFEFLKTLMSQETQEYAETLEKSQSPYRHGDATAYWVNKVDDGNSCLKELLDAKRNHEEFRAKDGYPINKSYHGPLVEAIEVLQAREPVTVEQLLQRIELGELEREDIVFDIEIREEARAMGWKNAHKPVEAEEAELANYVSVLATLKQLESVS
jgi:hypothetical protein